MTEYATGAAERGELSGPYEYCGRFPDLRLYRSLTVFRNQPSTTAIYICRRIGAGRTSWGRQEFQMRRLISEFSKNEAGATSIEYALIAAGLSIVILLSVNGIGSTLNSRFTDVNTSLK
jgi:pilus assembly protein Flp/PilA